MLETLNQLLSTVPVCVSNDSLHVPVQLTDFGKLQSVAQLHVHKLRECCSQLFQWGEGVKGFGVELKAASGGQ